MGSHVGQFDSPGANGQSCCRHLKQTARISRRIEPPPQAPPRPPLKSMPSDGSAHGGTVDGKKAVDSTSVPPNQARIIRLLDQRIELRPDGLEVRLRMQSPRVMQSAN